jgi:hypothetical protein
MSEKVPIPAELLFWQIRLLVGPFLFARGGIFDSGRDGYGQ